MRLYRSRDDVVCAGVFGGLGEHFGLDPVMLRLLFIVAIVFTGFVPGFIAYILAVLVVPKRGEVYFEEVERD
jgi:phage shock protein C